MVYFIQMVIAGIMGTALMTFYIFFCSRFSIKRIRVIMILGKMLASLASKKDSRTSYRRGFHIAAVTHYSVGILFSCIIGWMWTKGIAYPHLKHALITGGIIGAIAISVWALFIKMHPHPPQLSLPVFLFFIYTGHFAFCIGQLYAFLLLQHLAV
jgi:hypothetical protein